MNYFLKKKLYNFSDGASRFETSTSRFNFNLQETSLGPLFFTKKNFSLGLRCYGYARRTITMGQAEHDRCLKSLFSRGRQNTSRYQLLYIFLRGCVLRKKHSHLLKLKRLLPAFKIMVLNQSVTPQQKTRAGQGVSQSLVLYQTLNDYFFSPSFYFNINKGSRWLSMEEIINHFLFYSEGPCLPQGFSQGSVEAPKGHLGVSVIPLPRVRHPKKAPKTGHHRTLKNIVRCRLIFSLDFLFLATSSYIRRGLVPQGV